MLLILASIGKPDIVPAGCAVMFQASQCVNTIGCFPCHLNNIPRKGYWGCDTTSFDTTENMPGKICLVSKFIENGRTNGWLNVKSAVNTPCL